MPETERTYSTTEILSVAGVGLYFWRLDYLVRSGKITALNRVRGQERRFSEQETLRAINILRSGSITNLKELQEKVENARQTPVSTPSGPEAG